MVRRWRRVWRRMRRWRRIGSVWHTVVGEGYIMEGTEVASTRSVVASRWMFSVRKAPLSASVRGSLTAHVKQSTEPGCVCVHESPLSPVSL